MSYLGDIGEVIETGRSKDEISFDWKIPDFLSLDGKKGDYYDSPLVNACGGGWSLRIFPYGIWHYPPLECVCLILFREDADQPETFNITFGIRGAGGVENKRERTMEFTDDDDACFWNGICTRSELRREGSRLMPGNALVIALDIKKDVARAVSDDEAEEENNENNNDEDEGESKNKKKVKNTKKISFPARHADVIRSLKAILAGGSRADFTLKSGGGEWRVHRAILEGRSGHFEALFRLEWVETDVGVVPFHDITDQSALDSVLQFLYAGDVGGMSAENVFEIYAAAHKIHLCDLKCVCVEYMREAMRPGMVCDALALAETHGERELRESALQCFFREPARVCETEGWKRLKENRPAIIADLFEETVRRESKNRKE